MRPTDCCWCSCRCRRCCCCCCCRVLLFSSAAICRVIGSDLTPILLHSFPPSFPRLSSLRYTHVWRGSTWSALTATTAINSEKRIRPKLCVRQAYYHTQHVGLHGYAHAYFGKVYSSPYRIQLFTERNCACVQSCQLVVLLVFKKCPVVCRYIFTTLANNPFLLLLLPAEDCSYRKLLHTPRSLSNYILTFITLYGSTTTNQKEH